MNRGVLTGVAAYVLWGLSPIFWRLVDDVGAGDVILFRITATALLLGAAHAVLRTGPRVAALGRDRRTVAMAILTASLLASNWLVFVWAVNNERVLEVSLGYFINPLVSVVLGVVVLRERLRRGPVVAVAIAATGVLVLAVDVGEAPWVSLYLAASFGLYGLLRKTSTAGSLDGLTLEVFALAPIAVALIAFRAGAGDGVIGGSTGRDLWLLGTGVMTAAPLLLFASAARRIELWLVGMLQFIAPTLHFLLGVLAYGEEWRGGQVVGFVMIWLALAVFAADSVLTAERSARPAARRTARRRSPA